MGYLTNYFGNKTFDFKSYNKKLSTFFSCIEDENKTRFDNLQLLCDIVSKYTNNNYWLIGKTLLGIYKHGEFVQNDHDDDIGIDIKYINKLPLIYKELYEKGFEVIRITKNDSMFSVMKNNRYIDICIFKNNGLLYGYEKKWYPYKNFLSLNTVLYNNYKFYIPSDTNNLLKIMYG